MKVQTSLWMVFIIQVFLLLAKTCISSVQTIGQIVPHFAGSQMNWIDNQGMFLLSNSKNFAFGFYTTLDVTSFMLGVIHVASSKVVWTANRGFPVRNSDNFIFDNNGNVNLYSGNEVIWSTNTSDKGVTAMQLRDSGNLVLVNNKLALIWQSFANPTDTMLSGQNFTTDMKLMSDPNSNDLTYHLQITSGDILFYADFKPAQPYWSMNVDTRKIISIEGGGLSYATLSSNAWEAYDNDHNLMWQFVFSENIDTNVTWAAVLGTDGSLSFFNLQNGQSGGPEATKIPQNSCKTPEPCDPYYICHSGNRCQCPAVLSSAPNCKPNISNSCSLRNQSELVSIGNGLDYFATGFVLPVTTGSITACKNLCLANCSCMSMFFDKVSKNCFLFNEIGSLQPSQNNSGSYEAFVRLSVVSSNSHIGNEGNGRRHIVAVIVALTALVVVALVYAGVICYKRLSSSGSYQSSSQGEELIEELSGMPMRFSYKDLQKATNNFTTKLGHGGFGSVYHGLLPDGAHIAVKKLEGIGQGKKEFRAEVNIIGSIHHVHLVKLRGFCAEGTHRLLAYEYMANGSLDKWIFQKNNKGEILLDWDKRFSIALATAKGLAYLHEDCTVKIIHCDIKPENVLLDDNYVAKVSDFGLAKLMTREQSHVYTTLRGTRGYLAPEWLTNYAISEKSDVYSYGMLLLEIIGGRKNYDPSEKSDKAHFPLYAFKKVEEGKLEEILDSSLGYDEGDQRISAAIKVALWCIQDEMHLRPSMTKVVQMLEGLSEVPHPSISPIGFRLYSSLLKSGSEEGSSSGPSDYNSGGFVSSFALSGPR